MSSERANVIEPFVEAYREEGLEGMVGVTDMSGVGARSWTDGEQWGKGRSGE